MSRIAENRCPSSARGTVRSLLIRVLPLALLATTIAPQPVSAAEVIAPFNSVTLVANPRPWGIAGLPNTINGSTAGQNFARIFTGQAAATGVVIDYGFSTPELQVTGLQLFNNGGGDLFDRDGIGTATVEVFDPSSTVLFSGSLNAGNGSASFLTSFPTPLDNVARVRLSNITNLPGTAAPDIIWRELRALQNVATPRITTAIGSDGYSDNVTIAGTDGLDGTLTWTLYGPVGAGPSGTCSTATWTGAPVFDTAAIPITDDGVVLTTPSTPTADGCYSYGDVLASPYYTADAVSPVGQAAESFAWPVTPTITTAIDADGYSDDVTIRGTNGFGGTIAWLLLGPVNPGPGGTCSDATFSIAPTNAAGTLSVVGDVTVTVTPPADPAAPGCYTYEVSLTGPNIGQPVVSPRGEPAESFTRASTPALRTVINADGFSDDLIVTGTSGFAGTLTWTLFGPVGAGATGTCSDAAWVGAPVFDSGALPIVGDGTSTATPATPAEDGCYSYGAVLGGPGYTTDAVSAVGEPSETFSVPMAPPTTTTTAATSTTTPATVPAPTTDPCAVTTTSSSTTTTTTSSTTTTPSSTTTTSSPPDSAPGSSAPELVDPERLAPEASTTTGSPSTPSAAPPSGSPAGFSRAPAQVPCAPSTSLAPTTTPPTTPTVIRGDVAAGSGASPLPRTGHQPVGPIVIVAIAILLAGAALVITSRPRQ